MTKVGKVLLWLACRHHRLEIMLETVVFQELSTSSETEIAMFKRFKNNLEKNYQNYFRTFFSNPLLL